MEDPRKMSASSGLARLFHGRVSVIASFLVLERRRGVSSVYSVFGYLAPLFVFWLTLTYWRRHDAAGIDLRRDRKNLRRRNGFRAGIRWPVSVTTVAGSIQGRTKNVGINGVTLVSLQPLVRGETVPLTLSAPDRVIRVRGEVIWRSTFYPPKNRTPHKAIGILFRELSREDAAFLARSIEAWHEAEERRRVESKRETFFHKVCGAVKPCWEGRLQVENAFRSFRQRLEGVWSQAEAPVRSLRVMEAAVGAEGKKSEATR
jgi:hypothetical protein